MDKIDARQQAIITWLKDALHLEITGFAPASSDASFRRYFRVRCPSDTYIVMDAPPAKEDLASFIYVGKLFRGYRLPVPEIVAQELRQGFLLLEDFGGQCFLDGVNADNADSLYASAMDNLHIIQGIDTTKCQLPIYDSARLATEIGLFYQWFLRQTLHLTIPRAVQKSLDELLIKSAHSQPQVCTHLDYHSRNLMLTDGNNLGIIDFQDALIGPITYDLVSLLRDCYISWNEGKVAKWRGEYLQSCTSLRDCSPALFSRWFDFMGMQRHLKAVGIFSRLHIRDGKDGYLQSIPRTLGYIVQIGAKYPELAAFSRYLADIVLPAYQEKTRCKL